MKVLALDVATTCGWAVDRPTGGDIPLVGSFRCKHDGSNVGDAYVEFVDNLEGLVGHHKPRALVYEEPNPVRSNFGATTHATFERLLALIGLTEYVGRRNSLRVFKTPINSWRKHFIGKGNYPRDVVKELVTKRCILLGQRLNCTPPDHNAADAWGIWDYARHKLRVADVASGFAMNVDPNLQELRR